MATRDDEDEIGRLRERLSRLEVAVEATGLGLWEWDVPSGRLTWNERNRELFGVAHDGPLTIEDYPGLVHADDQDIMGVAYQDARDRPEGGLFSLEHRIRAAPDGKARWVFIRGRVIKDADGVRRVVGSTLDVTDRRTAEDRRNLVLRELAHRAKNGILVMMSLVAQTAKRAGSVKEFETVLTSRLQSMADSQELVTQAKGASLQLADLLDQALTPFDASRFQVDPELRKISISNEMVVSMALLLHELSTNAAKYGALSAPTGRVTLGLAGLDAGQAHLAWREVDGPRVTPPKRRGFGTRLVDIALRNDGGRVVARFEPAGFEADIRFPATIYEQSVM